MRSYSDPMSGTGLKAQLHAKLHLPTNHHPKEILTKWLNPDFAMNGWATFRIATAQPNFGPLCW
jgi:hypothetical protein